MLATMPAAAKVMISAEPPWLTKRSGTPDKGTKPNIAAIFKKDSVTMSMQKPTTTKPLKVSGAFPLIRNELIANNRYSKISDKLPTKPNSSASTAKMESSVGCGK